MSDIVDGGAPAPAESHSAPIDTSSAPQTAPLSSQAPVADRDDAGAPDGKPEASKSNREALEKAFAKADGSDKTDGKTTPAKEGGPNRGDGGKFAAKDNAEPAGKTDANAAQTDAAKAAELAAKPTQRYEAPSRFSAEAKTAWESAPDPVKAETHRALTELQQGYEKHKAGADAYESVKSFDEMAKQSGTTLPEALNRYVSLENALRQNPVAGLEQVCQNMGLSLRQVAAHVLNQTPDQQASQSDATIRELRNELASIKQQIGGVTGHIQSQQQAQTVSHIDAFARENPRFDELSETIAELLSTGFAKDLPDAYAKADRLNPSAAPAVNTQQQQPNLTPAPLNPAGSKSITGAPPAGSDPARRNAASPSTRSALERAFSAAGL